MYRFNFSKLYTDKNKKQGDFFAPPKIKKNTPGGKKKKAPTSKIKTNILFFTSTRFL